MRAISWIYLDLTIIALGAGAFFTGFLLYILRKDELKAVINSAVVLGFLCYSGAIAVLMVDVGQPLRAWFTFWHPNVHSMLTEVTFCLTCYLTVLAVEYAPIVLKNRKLRQIPSFLVFEFELHKVMYVKKEVFILLAKVSGTLLLVYVLFKAIDTLIWINSTSPAAGFPAFEFYARKQFGTWILFTEIVLLGLLPAWMLLYKKKRQSLPWLITAAFLACAGVVLNRFVMTIQTLSLPTLPFDQFLSYVPSWQEVATFLAVVAYGVLIYSISFRYMTLFPQERELQS